MRVRSIRGLAVIALTTLLVPAHAAAFECGGGSEWLESDAGEMCLAVAEAAADPDVVVSPELVARMEQYVASARNPSHRRAIVAAARCEVALLRGAWADADRFCERSSSLDRAYADAQGADASRAIALVHLGRRREASELAQAFARRECDAFDPERSSAFDQASTCARAFGVLGALAPGSNEIAVRSHRFATAWGSGDHDVWSRRLAACLVEGRTPCR